MNHSFLKYVHGVKKQFSKKKMLYIYVRMGIYFLPIRTGSLYSIYYFAKILKIGWNMALFLGSDRLREIGQSNKDTNRKTRLTFFMDYTIWILVPNSKFLFKTFFGKSFHPKIHKKCPIEINVAVFVIFWGFSQACLKNRL